MPEFIEVTSLEEIDNHEVEVPTRVNVDHVMAYSDQGIDLSDGQRMRVKESAPEIDDKLWMIDRAGLSERQGP